MFLSKEDLKALSGLQRQFAVKRWLDKERIPYIVGADDWPRVLRAVILERLGGKASPPVLEPRLRDWRTGKYLDEPELILDVEPRVWKGRKKR